MSALSISSPFPIFTDSDGQPLENGYIWLGTANLNPLTNPINVYWDEALTIQAAQPIRTLGGYPMNNGTPARLYVNSAYSIQVQSKNGSVVYSAPEPTEAFGGGIVNASQVVYLPAGTGAVATTVQTKLRETVSVADFGIVSDGTTDQTSAMVALMATLSSSGFRGWIAIPYNTKFTVSTVYAAVPVGVVLDDESSINWGQPPGYKNKFRIQFSSDSVSDDSALISASNHHAAFELLNTGSSGTASAAKRYASILHGVNIGYNKDAILSWQQLFGKHPTDATWAIDFRLQTPYSIAIANPGLWVTATVYAAGAYCISDSGKVYKTTAGGTSGVTAPTGTGTGINDGGVLWDYQQASLNSDQSIWQIDESGNGTLTAASGSPRLKQVSGAKSHYFQINSSTGDIQWTDVARGLNIVSVSDASGLQFNIGQSGNRIAITGTAPNAPVTGYGSVTNSGATNMSTITPVSGRNRMILNLRFNDGNTTVVHGTGANNLTLKGAVNVTVPNQSFMVFEYDNSITARWIEVSRSF